MAKTMLGGAPVETNGALPAPGESAPPFMLTRQDLSEVTLEAFAGKKKILNIFPSIDTGICATSVGSARRLSTRTHTNSRSLSSASWRDA